MPSVPRSASAPPAPSAAPRWGRVPGRAPIAYAPPPTSRLGALPTVATLLAPDERPRLDAAGAAVFVALHRDGAADLRHEASSRPLAAVVASTAALAPLGEAGAAAVGALVRQFPELPVIALVTCPAGAPATMLALGRHGVSRLVDARHPAAWPAVRTLLADSPDRALARRALHALAPDLLAMSIGARRFVELLFDLPGCVGTVRRLARALGVGPTTLTTRFARAGLPAPKRFLAYARLVRAAHLLEAEGRSLAAVATLLEYSSAQSFGRHVRTLLGVTGVELRRCYDGDAMLRRFRADLLAPHTGVLRRFTPFGPREGGVGDVDRADADVSPG